MEDMKLKKSCLQMEKWICWRR